MDSSNRKSPFLFDALDEHGDRVQGTMDGVDEDDIRRRLQDEFGYQVTTIHKKAQIREETQSVSKMQEENRTVENDRIIFKEPPQTLEHPSFVSEEKFRQLHQKIYVMIEGYGNLLSERMRQHLLHLDGKIDLLKTHFTRKHWWSLRWELRKALKKAKKEIEAYQEEKWKEYDEKENFQPAIKKSSFKTPEILQKIQGWMRKIDQPDPNNENEILIKQHYESIWLELQRFSGALCMFYLFCFFVAYYLKRNGFENSLFVRIYDALLFQQIVLSLFAFYMLASLRRFFLPKKVFFDVILGIIFLLTLLLVF